MRPTAIALTLGLAAAAAGQERKIGDLEAKAYLKAETAKLSKRFMDGAVTKDEWEAKRPKLKEQYLEMLGLWPLPEKTPLKATVTGSVDREAVVIEKLHYQSRPGLYVTANLYRPKKVEGKLPAILYVCGHSGRGRDGNKTAFQDHGMWFASHGYVCLIVDTLQLGEIAGIHHGTYREGRWWWQARGYTPAGVECWNGIRGIDYLISRPEVDPERIGVTGISGGGASTVWIAAADDRVKVAVPVSGMSDLESYVSNEVVNGHCDCMFLVNTYRWEWTTIAALIAPRPLLFANSDDDKIFPMDGNRRIIARLRDAYRMYEKADLVDDYVSKGGHDYRPDLRIAIFKWFHTHLKKDSAAVADAEFKPLPGKELRVFAEDKDLPADAINAKIDESFVATAKVELPAEGKFDEWKAALTKQLREKCFREWPVQVPRAKPIDAVSDKDMGFRQESETNIMVRMVYNEGNGRLRPTFYVMNVDEKLNELPKWAEDRFEGDIFTFYPRGSLALPWTRKNPPNTVERSMALLGRTADERRVWDSIASFRDIQFNSMVKEWRLAGRGQAGVMAAYAAILEPSVAEVVILEPPASHRDGPIFLNVLRVLDVSEALGLLAPRPLTIISNDPAFDKTAAIYKLAGAADKFKRVKPK